MKMKIKKELNGSPVTSLESWRKLNRGEKAPQKSLPSNQPRFRIAGYVRLSPSGDEREEGSLVSHPQRIKAFVEDKNRYETWGEIVDWYIDKDYSGKDTNRPNFQKMLTDIKAGLINAVVVTELSRLSRSVMDFCNLYEFFKQHKVAFFCLRENFDTSTAAGELMLMQSIAFAQYERQTIVDRIKKGSRARAERGLGNGFVSLGFKLVEHKPNHREIEESERSYIEMIFRKFLELKRIHPLIKYLNENGYRTKEFVTKNGKKAGGNRWTLGSVYSVLTNRSYIGEREINKKNRSQDQDELKEDDKYYFVKASWPALISENLFYDVQDLMEGNRKKARKYIHDYRLTGLIECAECGAALVGKSGTGRSSKYFYYGHKRKMLIDGDRHNQRCKTENIPTFVLEEAVIGRLKELSQDQDLVVELAKQSASESRTKVDHLKSLMATKEQERRKLEQKLDNLYDSISETEDKALRNGLSEKAKTVKELLLGVETSLEAIKAEYSRTSNVIDIKVTFQFFRIFRDDFEKQPLSVQAEILKDYIRRIVVKENVAIVEIYGKKREEIHLKDVNGNLSLVGSESGSGAIRPRTSVLTDFKLVAGAGFEPTTFGL
jgi:site-specific DNA recombinase